MERIGRRRDEPEMFVEPPGCLVLRMDRERSYPGDVSRLKRAAHRVFQEPRAESVPLPGDAHGQAGQQHDRYRMASQTFAQPVRRVVAGDLAYCQRIVADDRFPRNRDVSLRGTGLLIDSGRSERETG